MQMILDLSQTLGGTAIVPNTNCGASFTINKNYLVAKQIKPKGTNKKKQEKGDRTILRPGQGPTGPAQPPPSFFFPCSQGACVEHPQRAGRNRRHVEHPRPS